MSRVSVGEKLRQAREAQKVSLEQVSQATHIKLHHLQAIEAGNYEGIPSLTQARGFLRAYAETLKIDAEALLDEMEQSGDASPRQATVQGSVPASVKPSTRRRGKEISDTVPETTPVDATFQKLCHEIGEQLHRQREILGLSLDDVERHTHLRQYYLQIIESGELERLPSPVQGRGMLNNYATFLGLDPEPILLRYAEALQVRLLNQRSRLAQRSKTSKPPASSRAEVAASELSTTSGRRRFFTGELVFGTAIALFIIAFVIWGALRIVELSSSDTPAPTAPSIAEVLLATSTEENLPTATATGLAQAIDLPAPAGELGENTPLPTVAIEGVQVIMSVYQRALVIVTVDGKQAFYGRVIPGSAFTYSGKESVEILTSNAAGLQIFYNGQDQGIMGSFGQVVYRIYTPQGIITPTPTITITPTPTQIPTATPQPTQTVSPNLPTPPTQVPLP